MRRALTGASIYSSWPTLSMRVEVYDSPVHGLWSATISILLWSLRVPSFLLAFALFRFVLGEDPRCFFIRHRRIDEPIGYGLLSALADLWLLSITPLDCWRLDALGRR